MVYLEAISIEFTSFNPFDKFVACFYGPFKVLKMVGPVAYQLKLAPQAKIHPVFHISQLKKALGTHSALPTIPVTMQVSCALLEGKESVYGDRTSNGGPYTVGELPAFEATWEDYTAINHRFPSFNLEGKVQVWEGGNAMNYARPPITVTYATRQRMLSKDDF